MWAFAGSHARRPSPKRIQAERGRVRDEHTQDRRACRSGHLHPIAAKRVLGFGGSARVAFVPGSLKRTKQELDSQDPLAERKVLRQPGAISYACRALTAD